MGAMNSSKVKLDCNYNHNVCNSPLGRNNITLKMKKKKVQKIDPYQAYTIRHCRSCCQIISLCIYGYLICHVCRWHSRLSRTLWTMDVNLCGLLRAFHYIISQCTSWLRTNSNKFEWNEQSLRMIKTYTYFLMREYYRNLAELMCANQ